MYLQNAGPSESDNSELYSPTHFSDLGEGERGQGCGDGLVTGGWVSVCVRGFQRALASAEAVAEETGMEIVGPRCCHVFCFPMEGGDGELLLPWDILTCNLGA